MMSVELNMFQLQSLLQVKERLLKILTFWSDRKLYDKDTMQQLEAALLSGDPNAMLQAPAPKQVGIGCTRYCLQDFCAMAAENLLLFKFQVCGLAISHAAPVHIGKAIWYLLALGCNCYTQERCSTLADSKISKEEMGPAGASCTCSLQHRSNCESVHASSSAAVFSVPCSIPTAATSVTACIPRPTDAAVRFQSGLSATSRQSGNAKRAQHAQQLSLIHI